MRLRPAVAVGSYLLAWVATSRVTLAANQLNSRAEADHGRPAPGRARPARGPEPIYVNVEGGYEAADLHTLAAHNLTPESVESSGSGAFYGVGAGFRLAFFTLGGRVRGGHLSIGDLSTIDGELGAHIALERFEPYFTFGAGYAKLRASGNALAGIPDLSIHGFNARAGLGLDYYADKIFTVGVNFTGDLLAMARPGIDLSTSPQAQAESQVRNCNAIADPVERNRCIANVVHDAEGSSAGFAGTFSVVMGLHF
jgi:hypothetical protein